MRRKHDSASNLEEPTESEIYEAIRYLDRDERGSNGLCNVVVICLCSLAALLVFLSIAWFH